MVGDKSVQDLGTTALGVGEPMASVLGGGECLSSVTGSGRPFLFLFEDDGGKAIAERLGEGIPETETVVEGSRLSGSHPLQSQSLGWL